MVFSDLQLSLIIAGVFLVVAVWLYNMMQERKHRRIAERILGEHHDDVLAAIPTDSDAPAEVIAEPFERVEPVLEVENTVAQASEPVVSEERPAEPDDDLLDAFVERVFVLDCVQDIPVSRLVDLHASLGETLSKPRRCLLLGTKGWTELGTSETTASRHIRYTLQLADRKGPADAADINTVMSALRALAEEFEGVLQPVDVAATAASAQSLDGVCAATDVQIAVHLVHRAGARFPTASIKDMLGSAGLTLQADGNYHLRDDMGNGLFSVSGDGAIPFTEGDSANADVDGITFWLDVPRAAGGGAVFERMTTLAKAICHKLGGVLVDDQRRALGEAELAGIGRKINEIQADMAAAGFPAGGKRALRLFA
jgi:hypothetical protein